MTAAQAEKDAGAPSGARREVLIVLPGLLLAIMLAMLDQLIVSTALPRIVGTLGGVTHLSWVVTAYVLAATVTTPLYGKLGDMYGRKRLLVIGHPDLPGRLGTVRAGALDRPAHRVPRRPGPGRRRADGRGDRDPGRSGVAARARSVHGLHDGHDDAGHDRRAAGRRVHHRQPVLALDLLHQHAGRRGRAALPGGHLAPAAAHGEAQDRLPGCRPARAGRHRDRAADHLGRQPVRMGLAGDHRPRRAGRGLGARVLPGRDPGGRAGTSAARVPQPATSRCRRR